MLQLLLLPSLLAGSLIFSKSDYSQLNEKESAFLVASVDRRLPPAPNMPLTDTYQVLKDRLELADCDLEQWLQTRFGNSSWKGAFMNEVSSGWEAFPFRSPIFKAEDLSPELYQQLEDFDWPRLQSLIACTKLNTTFLSWLWANRSAEMIEEHDLGLIASSGWHGLEQAKRKLTTDEAGFLPAIMANKSRKKITLPFIISMVRYSSAAASLIARRLFEYLMANYRFISLYRLPASALTGLIQRVYVECRRGVSGYQMPMIEADPVMVIFLASYLGLPRKHDFWEQLGRTIPFKELLGSDWSLLLSTCSRQGLKVLQLAILPSALLQLEIPQQAHSQRPSEQFKTQRIAQIYTRLCNPALDFAPKVDWPEWLLKPLTANLKLSLEMTDNDYDFLRKALFALKQFEPDPELDLAIIQRLVMAGLIEEIPIKAFERKDWDQAMVHPQFASRIGEHLANHLEDLPDWQPVLANMTEAWQRQVLQLLLQPEINYPQLAKAWRKSCTAAVEKDLLSMLLGHGLYFFLMNTSPEIMQWWTQQDLKPSAWSQLPAILELHATSIPHQNFLEVVKGRCLSLLDTLRISPYYGRVILELVQAAKEDETFLASLMSLIDKSLLSEGEKKVLTSLLQ